MLFCHAAILLASPADFAIRLRFSDYAMTLFRLRADATCVSARRCFAFAFFSSLFDARCRARRFQQPRMSACRAPYAPIFDAAAFDSMPACLRRPVSLSIFDAADDMFITLLALCYAPLSPCYALLPLTPRCLLPLCFRAAAYMVMPTSWFRAAT